MPNVGGFLQQICRNQSKTVAKLNAAINKNRAKWKVIPLDKEGTRRGERFRYWSLNAFRKCVVYPLAEDNITYECGSVVDGERIFVKATLSFGDEWKEYELLVPSGYDLQEDKAWITTRQKELGDMMLQPLCQDAEDEEIEVDPPKQSPPQWETNYKNALHAIQRSSTPAEAAQLMARVLEHISAKTMAPDSRESLQQIVDEKFSPTEG
jgi:hypothetical protein